MSVRNIQLDEKSGGKSGHFKRVSSEDKVSINGQPAKQDVGIDKEVL
jgi:hypothetical protein